MIQEKQLRSNQRLLRTFINRTRSELNKLATINPNSQAEAAQWVHSRDLLTGLLRGAEQTLTLVDFFLGDGTSVDQGSVYGRNLVNVLELYHLANAMYDNHDSFLVRVVSDPTNPTESDVEWAEDRLEAFGLIKQLIGKPNETTTVEKILKYGAFARPKTKAPTQGFEQVRNDRIAMDKVLASGSMAQPSIMAGLFPQASSVAADIKRGNSRPIIDWSNLTPEQKRQAQAQLRRGVEHDPSLGGFLEVCFGMPAGTLVSPAAQQQEKNNRVENVLNVIRNAGSAQSESAPPAPASTFAAPRYGQSAWKSASTSVEADEVRIDLDEMADRVADEADGDEDVIGLDRLIERAINQYPELKQALTDPNSGYGIALVVSRR